MALWERRYGGGYWKVLREMNEWEIDAEIGKDYAKKYEDVGRRLAKRKLLTIMQGDFTCISMLLRIWYSRDIVP